MNVERRPGRVNCERALTASGRHGNALNLSAILNPERGSEYLSEYAFVPATDVSDECDLL
jgi:hypothetical protein